MNQLLQMQSEGKRELLVYHYQKIQDVDEVILQLLNEAGLDGFIKVQWINRHWLSITI